MSADGNRAAGAHAHEIRTSCMNAVDLLGYFSGILGVPSSRLIDGMSVDESFLRNTANWLDNQDTYLLYRNCQRAVPRFSHKDWYRVGQAVQETKASGYLNIILKMMSTDTVYRRLPAIIAHTSKVSEYHIVHSERGHIRLRYSIPNRGVKLDYTIGSECWYHLGVLSAIPKLQGGSRLFAATNHEICSMPLGHILKNCYEVDPSEFSYTDEGVVVGGQLLARWIRLRPMSGATDTFSGDYDEAERGTSNALLIVRELNIGGAQAFAPGEIYEAPHCLFDLRYESQSLVRRLWALSRVSSHYYEEQLRKTEDLYLHLHRSRYEEERLARAIRVLGGGVIAVSSARDGHDGNGSADGQTESEPASLTLTRREREVAERVALGMTNEQIADELFISRETVKRHLANVYLKIGVKNRVQLVRWLEGSDQGNPTNREA